MIAQRRMALAPLLAGSTQGHALKQGHVIPDFGCLADHHTHSMVNEEAGSNFGGRMDFYPGQPTGNL